IATSHHSLFGSGDLFHHRVSKWLLHHLHDVFGDFLLHRPALRHATRAGHDFVFPFHRCATIVAAAAVTTVAGPVAAATAAAATTRRGRAAVSTPAPARLGGIGRREQDSQKE